MVAGLGIYVYSQNKQMNTKIEELTTKLQEKEDICTKLEATLEQFKMVLGQINQKVQQHDNGLNILSDRINSLSTQTSNSQASNSQASNSQASNTQASTRKDANESFKKSTRPSKIVREVQSDVQKETRHVKPLMKEAPPVARVSKIQFKKPIVEDDSDDELFKSKSNNTNVDEEISDSDLDNEISEELAELDEDSSLKKD
jgi:hypothetical protein